MNKPDLETCTLQEACDYAVFKIVEQGKQCLSEKGGCAYGDGNGNHCAIGWLLDHNDKQLMNCGDAVSSLVRTYRDCGIPTIVYDSELVFCLLQHFHDDNHTRSRSVLLKYLSKHINTTAPQYQQWVEMGEIK